MIRKIAGCALIASILPIFIGLVNYLWPGYDRTVWQGVKLGFWIDVIFVVVLALFIVGLFLLDGEEEEE